MLPSLFARRFCVCHLSAWALLRLAAFVVTLFVSIDLRAVADEPLIAPSPSADVRPPQAASNWESFGCTPCMPPCEDCHRLRFPTSYVWAEGLILTRDNDARNRPLVLDLNTRDVLLTVGDLDFDWDGGLRVGYACREYDCWGVEFVYLGYFDQTAAAGVASNDDLALPGALGLAVNNFFAADDVRVHYTSDLQSAEASFDLCCVGCDTVVDWLAGFRYVYLGEGFGIRSFDSAESTTRYNVGTDNNLFGAQVGARVRKCRNCWAWEGTTKAGIYGNYMQQSQAPIVDFPDFEFRRRRETDSGDVAFVGDVNLSGIYRVTDVWGLRAGYNVIWIDGVALAPEQLDFSNGPNSGKHLEEGGNLFLHGVNVGVEARW
jgi:Putative beta barrel porin-7 (BBP7)